MQDKSMTDYLAPFITHIETDIIPSINRFFNAVFLLHLSKFAQSNLFTRMSLCAIHSAEFRFRMILSISRMIHPITRECAMLIRAFT